MKQLIIGIVLAVLLVGCGEKPKFSINRTDKPEVYANNPVFTKTDSDLNETMDIYKFTSTPTSVDGISTSDLDVLGGYVRLSKKSSDDGTNGFILVIKGKASFDRLFDRLQNDNDRTCRKIGLEKGYSLTCSDKNKGGVRYFDIAYEPLIDNTYFSVHWFRNN